MNPRRNWSNTRYDEGNNWYVGVILFPLISKYLTRPGRRAYTAPDREFGSGAMLHFIDNRDLIASHAEPIGNNLGSHSQVLRGFLPLPICMSSQLIWGRMNNQITDMVYLVFVNYYRPLQKPYRVFFEFTPDEEDDANTDDTDDIGDDNN